MSKKPLNDFIKTALLIKTTEGITYKEALKKASELRKKKNKGGSNQYTRDFKPIHHYKNHLYKLGVMPNDSFLTANIQSINGNGKKQKGKGNDDADLYDYNYDDIDYNNGFNEPVNNYNNGLNNPVNNYIPPVNMRKEERTKRFIARKNLNNLAKLKKKNDKYKLGYSDSQLREMAKTGELQ